MKGRSNLKHASLTPVPLSRLVNSLTQTLLVPAVNRSSFIVNHIHPGITVNTDEHVLALAIGAVLKSAVTFTENECIQIDAASSGEQTFIWVKDCQSRFYSNLSSDMAFLQTVIATLGGSISISSDRYRGTTITFTLSNTTTSN